MSESSEPGDAVRTALVEAGQWAEREAALPGPAQARQRSRSRANARVAGTAALTVLAVLVAVLGIGRLTGDDPAAVRPARPPVATSAAVPTTIPEDFELGFPAPSGPDHSSGPVDQLHVDVCPGQGIPGVNGAVDRRLEWRTGPEHGEGRGVLVFAGADGAVAFMGGLRTAANRCASGVPNGNSVRTVAQEPLVGAWGEGTTLVLVDAPAPGAEPHPIWATFLFAVRSGSAVALQVEIGEIYLDEVPTTPPPDLVARYRGPIDALAPKLCRWTAAGC